MKIIWIDFAEKLTSCLVLDTMEGGASCRLCLSRRPLLDLSDNETLAALIKNVLCLRFSLSQDTSEPHHVCYTCRDTVEKFVTLRDLAHRNEEQFLNKSQNMMYSVPDSSNQNKQEAKKSKMIKACGTCEKCKLEDCGICGNCQDMTKFGGSGKLKKKCKLRACSAQIQSKNLQKINKVVLSSASLNNNLPAKTSLSTSGIPKSPEAQEDVSSSHDVQEDVSTSPEVNGDVSTSVKIQGNVSTSPEVLGDVSTSSEPSSNRYIFRVLSLYSP